MSEYEHSITIGRAPEQVFSFISDARQSPRYLPAIRKIDLPGNERVRAEIEMFGHRIHQAGFFKPDQKLRRIDFGSEGTDLFNGWLRVIQGPDLSASDLTVHLSLRLPREQEEQIRRHLTSFDAMIEADLKSALETIKNICEGHGDPVDEADAAPA